MDNEIKDLREFGKFRLDVMRKVLWFENEPVEMQLKEIELLCVLTENSGEVVTKDELLTRVWSESFVEESNLSHHIYQIRKIFKQYGESGKLIQTVPKRGYRFAADLRKNGAGDLIFERHTYSQTLIEELEDSEQPNSKGNPASLPKAKSRRILMCIFLAGLAIATASLGFYLYSRNSVTLNPPINSVAVLPLQSLGNDNHKSLSLGFADALITKLGKLPGVRVLSINSVIGFTGEGQEPAVIGRELGVDAILKGTFQHANGKLRVSLRLIRTSNGEQIWAETFDESESEIFRLQDAITLETARALAFNINLENRALILKRYTENRDAFAAYQSGRFLFFQVEYARAIKEFEKALQFDPNYVLAYAGLADSYAFLANATEGEKRIDYYEKAESYAIQALALDPDLAEAHVALGWIQRSYRWDWTKSEKHLRRAVELDPNSSVAHQRLAYLYITLGKTAEAVALSSRARLLDPVNHSVGWAFYCNRQFRESAAEYARRLDLAKSVEKQREPRLGLAMAYSELGKNAEGISYIEQAGAELKNDFAITAALTIARYRAGETGRAMELLPRLEEKAAEKPGRWVRLAYVYAAMEKKAEAITALQKGLETRDDRLMWIKTMPHFDNLRDDNRFKGILRKMNFPAKT